MIMIFKGFNLKIIRVAAHRERARRPGGSGRRPGREPGPGSLSLRLSSG